MHIKSLCLPSGKHDGHNFVAFGVGIRRWPSPKNRRSLYTLGRKWICKKANASSALPLKLIQGLMALMILIFRSVLSPRPDSQGLLHA